nr:hypothetical protein [Tanacetum cinerariifolium]
MHVILIRGADVFFRLSRLLFKSFKTLCLLKYALMKRHDYDITSSLRRGALQLWYQSQMVNTRTDADLSAAVQSALQTLLPRIRTEIRKEFRTSSGPSDSGGNPPSVTIHTWLERFNKQKPRSFEKATAPMVNTRTDADFSAAVQNALQTLIPQICAEIREEFRTSSGPSDAGGNPPPVTIHTWLERFNKQKPHSFEKATAPVDAENWISHMEKIFNKAYKQAKGGDAWLITLTWAYFKKLFFLQFFPRAEQERLKREYHSIRQTNTETSTEFMQRFLRLAGFIGAAAGTGSCKSLVELEYQLEEVYKATTDQLY